MIKRIITETIEEYKDDVLLSTTTKRTEETDHVEKALAPHWPFNLFQAPAYVSNPPICPDDCKNGPSDYKSTGQPLNYGTETIGKSKTN